MFSPLGEALITKASPLTSFYISSVCFINSFFIRDMWCLPLGKKEAKFALLMRRTAARNMAPCQQFMQEPSSGEGCIKSVCTELTLRAHSWDVPIAFSEIHLRDWDAALSQPCTHLMQTWQISTDQMRDLLSRHLFTVWAEEGGIGPPLPAAPWLLCLSGAQQNHTWQWKFTGCCGKKQGKVKAQPRKISAVCTCFYRSLTAVVFSGTTEGKIISVCEWVSDTQTPCF